MIFTETGSLAGKLSSLASSSLRSRFSLEFSVELFVSLGLFDVLLFHTFLALFHGNSLAAATLFTTSTPDPR